MFVVTRIENVLILRENVLILTLLSEMLVRTVFKVQGFGLRDCCNKKNCVCTVQCDGNFQRHAAVENTCKDGA